MIDSPERGAVKQTPICSWLLLCWCLSIAQYSYRYIFQVNDTRTSDGALYSMTPWYLSIIKFELLAALVVFAVYRALGVQIPQPRRCYFILGVSWAAFATSLLILAVRLPYETGDTTEFFQNYSHLWPYFLVSAAVPFVIKPKQVLPTLQALSVCGFWLCFPFWLITVYLYVEYRRYPALSWPGHLRFGGVLDDPNAYGVLMSLLAVLATELRGRLWRFRVVACFVMILMTQSFSSYVLLVFMTGFYAFDLLRPRLRGTWVGPVVTALCLTAVLAAGTLIAGSFEATIATEIDRIWRFKQTSFWVHLEYLRFPDELADASAFKWIFGSVGHSENAFNSILLNFGLVGVLAYLSALGVYFVLASGADARWARVLLVWIAAVIVDSVACPFLAVFPINLLLWTLLACIIVHRADGNRRFVWRSLPAGAG